MSPWVFIIFQHGQRNIYCIVKDINLHIYQYVCSIFRFKTVWRNSEANVSEFLQTILSTASEINVSLYKRSIFRMLRSIRWRMHEFLFLSECHFFGWHTAIVVSLQLTRTSINEGLYDKGRVNSLPLSLNFIVVTSVIHSISIETGYTLFCELTKYITIYECNTEETFHFFN